MAMGEPSLTTARIVAPVRRRTGPASHLQLRHRAAVGRTAAGHAIHIHGARSERLGFGDPSRAYDDPCGFCHDSLLPGRAGERFVSTLAQSGPRVRHLLPEELQERRLRSEPEPAT